MSIILTSDGRRLVQIGVLVDEELKSKAKNAGINFTQTFKEALIAKLTEVAKWVAMKTSLIPM